MKQLQLLSYTYPNTLKLLIAGTTYTYTSSEFFCRKFLQCYEKGGRFNSLNWFRRVAKLTGKEVIQDGVDRTV